MIARVSAEVPGGGYQHLHLSVLQGVDLGKAGRSQRGDGNHNQARFNCALEGLAGAHARTSKGRCAVDMARFVLHKASSQLPFGISDVATTTRPSARLNAPLPTTSIRSTLPCSNFCLVFLPCTGSKEPAADAPANCSASRATDREVCWNRVGRRAQSLSVLRTADTTDLWTELLQTTEPPQVVDWRAEDEPSRL